MKKIALFICCFLLVSCQFFNQQVPSEQELLNKQLKEINWSEVDQYPSVTDCETISDKKIRNECFFEFFASTIQQKLNSQNPSALFKSIDTLNVKVTINADATLHFETQMPSNNTAYSSKSLDSIIQNKLQKFPKVSPAIKHGIPVKTQFILPVIIKTEK